MRKHWPIIKDAFILLVVSTLFVTAVNAAFKRLKKTNESDSLVTAIMQDNLEGVKEVLSESEFKKSDVVSKGFDAYLKERTSRADEHQRTALMWASYSNIKDAAARAETDGKRLPMVKAVLDAGASANARDGDGWTALMWASWSGLNQVAAVLVERGADVAATDQQGNTALTIAAQRGNAEIAEILLKKGADKAVVTKSGKNARELAEIGREQYPDRAKAYGRLLELLSI